MSKLFCVLVYWRLLAFFLVTGSLAGHQESDDLDEIAIPLSATLTRKVSPFWIDNQSFLYSDGQKIKLIKLSSEESLSAGQIWESEHDVKIISMDYFDGILGLLTSDASLTLLSVPSKQVIAKIDTDQASHQVLSSPSLHSRFRIISKTNVLFINRSSSRTNSEKQIRNKPELGIEFSQVESPPTLFQGLSRRRGFFLCLSDDATSFRFTRIAKKTSLYYPRDSEKQWSQNRLMGNDVPHYGTVFYDDDRDILIFDTINYWSNNELSVAELIGSKKLTWELEKGQRLLDVNFFRSILYCADQKGNVHVYGFSGKNIFNYTNRAKGSPQIVRISPEGDRILLCQKKLFRVVTLEGN